MHSIIQAPGNANAPSKGSRLSRIMACLFVNALLWIDPAQSIAQLQQAGSEAQKAEAWIINGYMHQRSGDKTKALKHYEEAVKIYRRAIKSLPANVELWKNLGFVHWLFNNRKDSLAAYQESVRLKPDDAESHYMLGFLQSSNPDAALGEYREAARLEPSNANYHIELGLALAKKKDTKAAIAEVEKAIRLDPRNGENYALLGGIWLGEGDLNKAISEYRKASLLRKPGEVSASFIELFGKEKKLSEVEDLNYWIRKAEDWQTSAAQHMPGAMDEAAVKIGSWPISDIEAIISVVVEQTGKKMTRSHEIPNSLKNCYLEFKESFKGKLKLAKDLNPILKRGVLLHTDISVLRLETGRDDAPDSDIGLVHDGIGIATSGGQHWEFARLLLNSLPANPSKDETMRLWYISTTAHMLSCRDRIYADQNLKQALKIFPNDAKLLFYAGALHESYASPKSQNAIPPPGRHYLYGAKIPELESALIFLTNSIESDPGFNEAHLRLGRVLGLLGDHKKAIAELQKADATLTNPKLKYYASLFLGYEFAALERHTKARECFTRAATLFPMAQAPLLAASYLARSRGDFETSLHWLQKVFTLSSGDTSQNDPWWEYEIELVRDWESLLAGMRNNFGGVLQ